MPRVMIVDDSVFMREHLANLLASQGYDSIQAMNGYEAVRQYRAESPDVVLMDVTMPGRDGLDTLEEVIQIDPGAVVVMLTALNQEVMVTRAMHIGAKDYLTKPVSPGRLFATLDRVLRYKRVPDTAQ